MTPGRADSRPRRHALVVAVQCQNMGDLPTLEEAARRLANTLLDPQIGDCAAGLPDGEACLYGELSTPAIEPRVRSAIEYAASQRATLVLAMLGHGFIAGTDLYLMGWDSVEDIRDRSVNVGNLLIEAADRPGVNGVVGIIDTCNAAAAQSGMSQLALGIRGGQARLSLLMASVPGQEAYGLHMSRKLTDLMRGGLPDAGSYLSPNDMYLSLRDVVPEQCIVCTSYDGAQSAEPLWLARNNHPAASESLLGSRGRSHLTRALSALYPEQKFVAPWTIHALLDLKDQLASELSSPELRHVQRLVDNLLVAQKTISFVRLNMAEHISTQSLRRALAVTESPLVSLSGSSLDSHLASEVDAIESMALNYPVAERSCLPRMARFMIELAAQAGIDPASPVFRKWADSVGANMAFNDALTSWQAQRSERRLRLIVSLHYALPGEWPDEVGAWTLCDSEFRQHRDFPCSPDQVGVEKALCAAVDWAEEHAEDLGVPLRRIEVAVPADKALYWHPEQVEYVQRLGVDYDVLTRWSHRLKSVSSARYINRNAWKRLKEIAAVPGIGRINWLTAAETADQGRLGEALRSGLYTRALGLTGNPGDRVSLLELLLLFTPIVIWPQAGSVNAEHRRRVDACWTLLPVEFLAAYRARWRADSDADPLADLRAVWDDEEWLEFCKSLRAEPGIEQGGS